MLEIAAPAHRRLASPHWRWLNWMRWWLAVRGDRPTQLRRLQMQTRGPVATSGEPGPAQVVDLLFQQHAHTVLAYLVHRLPTLPDAEDALDDVFLAALNACASGQTLTGGWLMVAA